MRLRELRNYFDFKQHGNDQRDGNHHYAKFVGNVGGIRHEHHADSGGFSFRGHWHGHLL